MGYQDNFGTPSYKENLTSSKSSATHQFHVNKPVKGAIENRTFIKSGHDVPLVPCHDEYYKYTRLFVPGLVLFSYPEPPIYIPFCSSTTEP